MSMLVERAEEEAPAKVVTLLGWHAPGETGFRLKACTQLVRELALASRRDEVDTIDRLKREAEALFPDAR